MRIPERKRLKSDDVRVERKEVKPEASGPISDKILHFV